MNTVPSMSAPVAGDPVELQVSSDMVKRGLRSAACLYPRDSGVRAPTKENSGPRPQK